MRRTSRSKAKLVYLSILLSGVVISVGLSQAHAIKHVVFGDMAPASTKQLQLSEIASEFRSLRMALRTLAYMNLPTEVYDTSLVQVRGSIEKLEALTASYRQTAFADGEEVVFNNLMDSWTEFHAFGSRVIARHAMNSAADREAAMKMLVFESFKYIRAFERDAAVLEGFNMGVRQVSGL